MSKAFMHIAQEVWPQLTDQAIEHILNHINSIEEFDKLAEALVRGEKR